MRPDSNDKYLVKAGSPAKNLDIKPENNDCIFTLETSGVYSIELTVEDRAGIVLLLV